MSNNSRTDINIDSAAAPAILVSVSLVYAAVTMTGVLLNPVIILTILKTKSLHTAMNCHLVSLAISDLVVCLVVIPCRLLLYNVTLLTETQKARCKLDVFLKTTCDCIQFATLGGMSYERYKSVSEPFNTQKSKKRTLLTVILSWLCAISIGALTSIEFGDSVTIYPCYREFSIYSAIPFEHFSEAFITLPLCIICLGLIIIFYFLMIKTLKQHNKKMKKCVKVAPIVEKEEEKGGLMAKPKGPSPDVTTTTTKSTAVSVDTNFHLRKPCSPVLGSYIPVANTDDQKNPQITDTDHRTIQKCDYTTDIAREKEKLPSNDDDNEQEAIKVHVFTRRNIYRTSSTSSIQSTITQKSTWRQLVEDNLLRKAHPTHDIQNFRNSVNVSKEKVTCSNARHHKEDLNERNDCDNKSPSSKSIHIKDPGGNIYNNKALNAATNMETSNEDLRHENFCVNHGPDNIQGNYSTKYSTKLTNIPRKTDALETNVDVGLSLRSENDNASNLQLHSGLNSSRFCNTPLIKQKGKGFQGEMILPLSSHPSVRYSANEEPLCLIDSHTLNSRSCTEISFHGTGSSETANKTKQKSIGLNVQNSDTDCVESRSFSMANVSQKLECSSLMFVAEHTDNKVDAKITDSRFNTLDEQTLIERPDLPKASITSATNVIAPLVNQMVTEPVSKVDVVEMDGTVHKNVSVEGSVVGAVCVMNRSNRLQGRRRVEMRAAKRIAFLIGSFVLLWLPLPVIALFLSSEKQTSSSDIETLLVIGSISALTGAFNPVFNLLLNKQLRSASFRILKSVVKVFT